MKLPLELLQRCWFLAGPTACGKSALSLTLADALGGEIISMDSMAIYRGMDIGTAKANREDRARIPHHVIDVVDPCEEFSTAEFLNQSISACEDIITRGKTPIFVGGTGLYLRALLRGVFEGPPADWEFRNILIAAAEKQSPDWLHLELQKVDPVTANRLHANDARRLIRALEIHALTGVAPSVLQQESPLPEADRPRHVYWLHPPRKWLHDRINDRVEWMFERGLEQEVRHLLEQANPPGRSARQALGYREMIDWIENRLPSQAATLDLIQTRTRQFAKRQHTWFRNLEECVEIPVSGSETVSQLCERLLKSHL